MPQEFAESVERIDHERLVGVVMSPASRILLWFIVLVAPGGLLLLPLLLSDMRNRQQTKRGVVASVRSPGRGVAQA